MTPRFRHKFFHLLTNGTNNTSQTTQAHTVDLVLMAFFFVMRSCDYTKPA
jgi:hypothetical protein